jgi:hypothetical protein
MQRSGEGILNLAAKAGRKINLEKGLGAHKIHLWFEHQVQVSVAIRTLLLPKYLVFAKSAT